MKTLKRPLLAVLLVGILFASCENDFIINDPNITINDPEINVDNPDTAGEEPNDTEDPDTTPETTTFNVTITNLINLFNTVVYNTGDNASAPGSINQVDDTFTVQFQAVEGARMSFVSMSSVSNDWIFAPRGTGIEIFDANGTPLLGNITDQILLWDAGTEEENPATFGGSGADLREDDDDNTVRIVSEDTSPYIRVELTNYDEVYRMFTMVITNVRGVDADPTPIRVSPGIVVLHALDDPLFTEGQPDRGQGLQLLAERGNPDELSDWFNATGSQGAPLRLASSYSTISPGIVYAFNSETDPWFTQGEPMSPGSGVEELAEAGNNQVAFDYLDGLGIPVAQSNETRNLEPGESLTFTLEVPTEGGYKLGIGTMLVRTNDWFMSFNNNGVPLFDGNGNAFAGISESDEAYLFDAGTEADEFVGIGDFLGTPPGPADDNTIIRRVTSIDDRQFGKGLIESAPGVVWIADPRGGYNFIDVNIQPQ